MERNAYCRSQAAYLTGVVCINNYNNGRCSKDALYLHKRANCRLCTQHVQFTYVCIKCHQCFCIIHLLKHISLFQQIRNGLLQDSFYSTYDCNSQGMHICNDFIKFASPKMARTLASNLSTNSVELCLYYDANPKIAYEYMIGIAKPKNITGLSRLHQ